MLSLGTHPSELPTFVELSSDPFIIPKPDLEGRHGIGERAPNAQQLYGLLQSTLHEVGLPETQDRCGNQTKLRNVPGSSDVALCVLGSPLPYWPLLLEGSRVCPGDMLLCLSPAWLSKAPSELHPGLSTLLLHKAITFDVGGRTYLDEFDPPRRVTYLIPCPPVDPDFTHGLDCPMGGSFELNTILGDTLYTRILLEKNHLVGPPTLGLIYKPVRAYSPEGTSVTVVEITSKTDQTDLIKEEIKRFLASPLLETYSQVVLKPSGGRWCTSRRPMWFLERGDLVTIQREVYSLLTLLEEGESVLLEALCPTMRPASALHTQTWDAFGRVSVPRPNLAFRICAIVTRSPEGLPLLNQLICSVGRADQPLHHGSSLPQTLETTLQEWGIADPVICNNIQNQVRDKAQACMKAIMEMEKEMSPEQRGGRGARMDLIGVDLVLSSSGQVITPNSARHQNITLLRKLRIVPVWRSGQPGLAEALLHTPLNRSQRYIMEGRNVLVIGAGGVSKSFIWESARDYGLKIHLVESDPAHFAAGLVSTFLHLDVTDHKRDPEHCVKICESLSERGIKPDGCLSFWDDCIVLVAMVCERLGLHCSPLSAVQTAKQKSQTHLRLLERAFSTNVPLPSTYTPNLTHQFPSCPESTMQSTGTFLSSYTQSTCFASIPKASHATDPFPVSSFSPPFSNQSPLHAMLQKSNQAANDRFSTSSHLNCPSAYQDSVHLSPISPSSESSNPISPLTRGNPQVGNTESLFCHPTGNPDSNSSLGSFINSAYHSSWTPSPHIYAVPCYHLESHVDIEKASKMINFPAVMKLEFGAGAVGVKRVDNQEQSHTHFEKISNDLREETDYPGIGLGWGNAMTMMEYLSGTEHDVDLVVYNGQMIASFVSDNGPTRVPYFTETAAAMPSYLRPDKKAQLVEAALRCCLGCGLTYGVFNVEMKMTPTGPRLIEINARMGGFYLRDWIRAIYGVDILFSAFMVACGVRPRLHQASPPLCHLIGVMCVVSQHLRALKTTASSEVLRLLHARGIIRLNQLDDELIASEYEEPYCNVACQSQDRDTARLQLLSICQILGIDSPDYPVSYFVSDFK
ncbi:carnosine synthase 1-like isoform X3 [Erpetoichthys calabaricus]|uniref:carnosine synthase 1-like isoform X2 n=2 Tax=Erpetoichthys calabaricus TaxID=27687 RepID=UPI002234ACCF|nr:carnosine synthase 1-like isoform X2 [Erpetoichthys calabaricus]XP_051788596.1 carnosine synthase 1-like isoform X3 [Erpetoichthys calabaricus]